MEGREDGRHGGVNSSSRREGKPGVPLLHHQPPPAGTGAAEGGTVRSHWSIENSVHWLLDVAFREDESRVRDRVAAENLSLLRKIALNILKQDEQTKLGIKNKRLRAGWDEEYLANLLNSCAV
jgi:hypothetical protein